MIHKKSRRAASFLGLLLALTLCVGTLLQGFAFAENTDSTQTSQTEDVVVEENGDDGSALSENGEAGSEAEENAAVSDEGAEISEDEEVSETEEYKTPALVITGNGATSKSSTLYKKTAETSEVGITVTYDPLKDAGKMTGYTVQKYSLWDVTDTDESKHVLVKDTKDEESFTINEKRTFVLTNEHKYEARAIATKDASSPAVTSESLDVASASETEGATVQSDEAGDAVSESGEAATSGEAEGLEIASESTYSTTVPAQVTNVKATCASNDNLITVTWDKAEGANTYYVYRTTSTATPDQTKPIKTITSGTTTKYTERRQGGSYYYWILPVNTNDQTVGDLSVASGKVTAGNYLTGGVRNYWFTGTTKKKTPIYKSASSKKVVGYLSKGTTFTIQKKSPKKVAQYGKVKRVYFNENGKKGWVKYSAIKKTDHVAGKANDWSKSVKEAYVNGKGYTSKTKYLIWVSKYTQKVNVFKKSNGKWTLIKTYRCSTGTFAHPTPTNLNYIVIRKQYRRDRVKLSGVRYYYKYLSAFGKKGSSGKGNAFHTITWNTRNNKPNKKVKDRPDTKGCVRMFTSEAKWIYKNIPNKTRVVSY